MNSLRAALPYVLAFLNNSWVLLFVGLYGSNLLWNYKINQKDVIDQRRNAKKALWDRIVVSTWTTDGHDIEHDAPFYSALRKLRDRGQTHIETYLTDLYHEFTEKADAVLARKIGTAEFDDADVHALVTEFEERLAQTPRVRRVPIFQVYETPEQK